jgi:hypothetical protein
VSRGIVAKKYQLDCLEPHDAIRFGPTAIIANAHADIAAEGTPNWKAQVARFEIPLLQMLEWVIWSVIGMPRQVHFPIFADHRSCLIDQDGRMRINARADLCIRPIASSERDIDQNFSGAGTRLGHLGHDKLLRSTRLVDHNGLHI